MSNLIKISTHSNDAQSRLIFQYQNSVNFKRLIDSLFGQQIQSLEDGIYDLLNRLDIDASSGIQLDNIGILVGQDRLGLSDNIYRLFLKARIGKNVSEAEADRVVSVWQLISQSESVHLVEAYPCEIDLYYDTALDENLIQYAYDLIQDVVGAGIVVEYIAVFDIDNAFSFESNKKNANGFGDCNDISKGGKFAYIQNVGEWTVNWSLPVFSFYPSDPDITTDGFGDKNIPSRGGKLAWIVTS